MSDRTTPSSQKPFLPALVAGIAAGGLFVVCSSKFPGLTFITYLPILLIGLAQGASQAAFVCFAASLVMAPLLGGGGVVFFCALFALPAYYFIFRVLLWRGSAGAPTWYPVVRALSELTILFASYLMLEACLTQDTGGLKPKIQSIFQPFLNPSNPEVAMMMKNWMLQWSFMFASAACWFWILSFYGLAVLANRLLVSRRLALRPSLAMETHGVNGWLLFLLLLSALFSVVGDGMDQYMGRMMLTLFLLPYFLSGTAFMHQYSTMLIIRRLWITCFYIALIMSDGIVLLGVVGIGLYMQFSELLDKRPPMR